MSGGGATQVSNSNPWAQASPYLTDIMGRAQSLYGSSAPFYTNPSTNFSYPALTGAVGNSIGGTTGLGTYAGRVSPLAGSSLTSAFGSPFGTAGGLDATGAIQKALTGQPDYSAVNGAVNAANTQQWNQFYNNVVPQLNQRASFLGNPSGAIKDLNSAVTNLTQNQNLNAQQSYLGQYDLAQQQQQAAAGLVAQGGLSTQQNALGLGGLGGNLLTSTGQQSLTGASLFPSISQLPQQNLSDYASIIGNTGGRFGSGTLNINPGAAGTASNIIGGLTAGTGLVNSLVGNGTTPGVLQNVGQYFGTQPNWSSPGGYDAGPIAPVDTGGTPDMTGGGPLYSGATNAANSDFSGSYPTALGNTTDVGSAAGGGNALADIGGAGGTGASAYGALSGGGAAASGATGAAAPVVSEYAQPVAYDAFAADAGAGAGAAAADAGASTAATAASSSELAGSGAGAGLGAAAGAAAGIGGLYAAYLMYEHDPVGSPRDQANMLLGSMQNNPYPQGTQNYQTWQNFTNQMQQWATTHGDLNGFWQSMGINPNVPGGPSQPRMLVHQS